MDSTNRDADLKLGFVGAGKMAQAIIKGVLASGLVKAENIMGSARTETTKDKIKELGLRVGSDNNEVAKFGDVIVLGVKPHMIVDVISPFTFLTSSTLVVSVAAGVTTSTMKDALPEGVRVVRVMPNLPVEVGAGTCCIAAGPNATSADMALLTRLLQQCGYVEVMEESQIDTSSSVLATIYGCVAVEALADGCVKMGMPRHLAMRLSAQSLLGASKLILDSEKHPAVLKDETCSPGGTSIAAVHHLEANNFRSALIGAIDVQTTRARYLGKMAAEAKK